MADGQEALDYLFCTGAYADRDKSDFPALTLLDLRLPRVSGLDVLRRIRAEPCTRRLPVVILSSSRQEQDMAASYDLGVNSYIRKPMDFAHFVEAVTQLGLYWLVLNEDAAIGQVEGVRPRRPLQTTAGRRLRPRRNILQGELRPHE